MCQVPNGGLVKPDGAVVGPDGTPVANACQNECRASQYALTCIGETPASIPMPDFSLGCIVLAIPTPSNQIVYCCPCGTR